MKKRIYHNELMAMGVCPWTTWKTTKKKIETEEFPHSWDGGRYVFEPLKVEEWFKKRMKQAA